MCFDFVIVALFIVGFALITDILFGLPAWGIIIGALLAGLIIGVLFGWKDR